MGQTVFDEVCTLFSGVLLIELQRECSNTVRDFTFQEVLLAKPLNVISWPFIARNLLIVLRQSFKPVEAVHVFNAPATEKEVIQLITMCYNSILSILHTSALLSEK